MPSTIIRLGSGRLPLVARELDLGPEVMYATVVDGRVTAVLFGELPASDDTTLYVDLSRVEPLPAVDDYFADVCQTFSSVPPVIPAGDSAPPFTPGSPPPTPGGPEYPVPELDPADDLPVFAPTAFQWLSFHADGADPFPAVGTGAGLEEVDPRLRTIVNVSEVCAVRLQAHVVTEDALDLVLCYRNDLDEWEELSPAKTGPKVSLSAAGTYAGLSTNVDPTLSGDVLLSLCVRGSGTASLGNVLARFAGKTGPGVCVELEEPVPTCDVPGVVDPDLLDDFTGYANYAAFWARADAGADVYSYTDLPSTPGAVSALEAFPGGPWVAGLRVTYRTADAPDPSNQVVAFNPPAATDVAMVWQGVIPAGVDFDEYASSPLVSSSTDNAKGYTLMTLRNSRISASVVLRAGKIILEDQAGGVATVVGADISAYAGDPVQIILQVTDRSGGPTAYLYLDPACHAPAEATHMGNIGVSAGGAGTNMTFAALNPVVSVDLAADVDFFTGQIYFTDDPDSIGATYF